MNTNHWHPSGPIEYEDRLRKLSRPKPAHPITVFEVKPSKLFQKIRHLLFGLVRGAARWAGSMKQRQEPTSPSFIRPDTPQA
jgi:hypothetical protein